MSNRVQDLETIENELRAVIGALEGHHLARAVIRLERLRSNVENHLKELGEAPSTEESGRPRRIYPSIAPENIITCRFCGDRHRNDVACPQWVEHLRKEEAEA